MITGIAAHLWQSTVFACAAWLVALMLRRNRAQDRYWIWFIASAKFLVPFSLLVQFGTFMPHRISAPMTGTQWLDVPMEFSRPLRFGTGAVNFHGAAHATASGFLQVALLVLWAFGVLVLMILWLLRWRRVRVLLESARPVFVRSAWKVRVPVMSAPNLIEPGVIGVFRPVLLLPEGIQRHLSPTQMDAIFAHELCHVRRKDNLTAGIHMAVQAIFWFHPLTWWIGTRLVDERERACDEEVLSLGCSPRVYAETILQVCKSYFSAPLFCVSGVTGSNLKSRIERIVRNRKLVCLNRWKKVVLASAALASVAAPVISGIVNAPAIRVQDARDWQTRAGGNMAFEVASVKLSTGAPIATGFSVGPGDDDQPAGGRFRATTSLRSYIDFAYKLWPSEELRREFSRLPKWVTDDRYTIEAKAPIDNPTKDQMRLMMQSLLADRFQLVVHFDAKEVPVFELRLAKAGQPGPKLISHAAGPPCDKPPASPGDGIPGFTVCGNLSAIDTSGGPMVGSRDMTMEVIASSLSAVPLGLGRPLIDKTGLKGSFDFTLQFTPEPVRSPTSDPALPPAPSGTTGLEALRDQLGLKVEPGKASLPFLVIDKVERPSGN